MIENAPKTTITLTNSNYAHGFSENELIHKEEYHRVIELINKQIERLDKGSVNKTNKGNDSCCFSRFYNTISVLGERGTGKTSFLYSIVDYLEKERSNDIQILGFIDPTIIEEKEHIFLLVISLINQLVEKEINKKECQIKTKSFYERQKWNQQLMKMAKGIPTLDKVGAGRDTAIWQSHDFIMEKGLDIVYSAFSLEKEFHKLVNVALEILGKKCFVLVLDDIDVDMKKGWDVLEMLRKYITTPQIITILSGNLKLYSINVRGHQWALLAKNRKYEEENDFLKTVNELEGQYLLKVLKSDNRVHLHSILESMEMLGSQYVISYSDDGDKKPIVDAYKCIFGNIGIRGNVQQNIFINYMLRLSVRSQIQFLLNNWSSNKQGLDSVEAFLSRLYASDVDISLAINNAQMLPLTIQRYLERQESAPDLYQLTPNCQDEDMNACLTAFSILFCKETPRSNFLIFDYLVRLGYVRNLLLAMDTYYDRDDFYYHVGLKQVMSLKNSVGLSIAFCVAKNTQLSSHVELLSFANKLKKDETNSKGRLDYIVNRKANRIQGIITYLPVSVIKYSDKNESRLFYSFYNILAVIAMALKEKKNVGYEDMLRSLLVNLRLLRTYSTWKRDRDMQAKFRDEESDANDYYEEAEITNKKNDDAFEQFVQEMISWGNEYHECVPPYLLGKIATRLYYTLQKINESNLGDQMHRSVMAFLNACLIEELPEYYEKKDNNDSLDKLNLSNVITNDKIFFNNLSFVNRNSVRNCVKLTEWMMKCPLLLAYLNPDTIDNLAFNSKDGTSEQVPYKTIDSGDATEWNVYSLLCQVNIKGISETVKPVFSVSKDNYIETKKILEDHGYPLQDLFSENRDNNTVKDILNQDGIFSNKIRVDQIKKLREYFKL